jgi:5'(3')-deoxyribonucleotidase
MPRLLSIAVDLDGIVVDLYTRWLELYNDEFGHGATVEDIVCWDMAKCVKIGNEIFKYLSHPNLYVDLEPLPGAIEALKELDARGHEVHIITASAHDEQTAADKLTWCKNRLTFMRRHRLTISHQKHRFLTDVFIDDSTENQQKHKALQPNTLRLGIAWPHNRDGASAMVRVESYRDTASAWKEILEHVERFAQQDS